MSSQLPKHDTETPPNTPHPQTTRPETTTQPPPRSTEASHARSSLHKQPTHRTYNFDDYFDDDEYRTDFLIDSSQDERAPESDDYFQIPNIRIREEALRPSLFTGDRASYRIWELSVQKSLESMEIYMPHISKVMIAIQSNNRNSWHGRRHWSFHGFQTT